MRLRPPRLPRSPVEPDRDRPADRQGRPQGGRDDPGLARSTSKSGRIKSGDLAAALASGDLVAVAEVHRAAHFLGLGIGGLVNLLGPEIVILGGGVVEAVGPAFLDEVRQAARHQILIDPDQAIKIEPAALGDDAGILGAALLARERFSP